MPQLNSGNKPSFLSQRKNLTIAAGFLGILALVGTEGFLTFQAWNTPKSLDASPTVVVEIKRGELPSQIIKKLKDQNLLSDPDRFERAARILRVWGKLKAGEYELRASQSPRQIVAVLSSGISLGRRLTIREGENRYEIAEELERLGFGTQAEIQKWIENSAWIRTLKFPFDAPSNLEGYLFPETYSLNKNSSIKQVLQTLVKTALEFWTPENIALARERGLTPHEAVILASMVEKETGAPEERPLIASVFYNRLQKKMRLQSDPTTIYGMWATYTGNIRRDDLLRPTPYNTYTIPRLPAGPIGSPGHEALHAVLRPATSGYLYFVSKNDGTHEFNSTLEGHNDAVQRLQRNARAREGKSWRDLNKSQSP
jgi:UPF0755 protein